MKSSSTDLPSYQDSMTMELAEVRQRIKEWEYSFKKQNDRQPSKQDIKENEDIHKLYSLYKSFKQASSKPTNDKPKPKREEHDNQHRIPSSPRGQLGPTPQANGKVLSIFDFRLTPPESSPLKRKSTNNPILPMDQPPRSPMKRIQIQTPTKPKSTGLLLFKTPTKPKTITFETPGYMAPNRNSLKPPVQQQVEYVTSPKTPIFGKVTDMPEFSVSPSPLKSHRFLGRKLADVYNDSLEDVNLGLDPELVMEMETIAENNNEEDDHDEVNENEIGKGSGKTYKKAKTQKRSTRRVKMAPRPVAQEDGFKTKDIQLEVSKMNEEERRGLESYINSDEEEEEEEEEVAPTSKDPIKRGRKPVTANYKRMKINDPRTRNFKRRMGRR
ncbi:SLD2 [[Candida] subhashii]|uniref:DNA replication regulator SLD2 n=1 Tax=[Candida] subhashii TaxID=561895 RepID=A0A8J5QJV5_9ASCO|nr:SLD2 [[Candida] subhashii]KAG7663478.1 SLD2 [[Candida] subhashii]